MRERPGALVFENSFVPVIDDDLRLYQIKIKEYDRIYQLARSRIPIEAYGWLISTPLNDYVYAHWRQIFAHAIKTNKICIQTTTSIFTFFSKGTPWRTQNSWILDPM